MFRWRSCQALCLLTQHTTMGRLPCRAPSSAWRTTLLAVTMSTCWCLLVGRPLLHRCPQPVHSKPSTSHARSDSRAGPVSLSRVGNKAAHHHCEASLQSTIIGLAHDFVVSNNVNVLVPASLVQSLCRSVWNQAAGRKGRCRGQVYHDASGQDSARRVP